MTRALQRCVCFRNRTQIDFKRSLQSRPSHCHLGSDGPLPPPPPPPQKKKVKKEEYRSSFRITGSCFRVNKTMSRSREFPCVVSSLLVKVKQNSNEDVEVTVHRSHSQSAKSETEQWYSSASAPKHAASLSFIFG